MEHTSPSAPSTPWSKRAPRGRAALASRLFWILVLGAVATAAVRIGTGGASLANVSRRGEYAYEQVVTIHAAPGDYSLSMYIPQTDSRVTVLDERFEASDIDLTLQQDGAGRKFVVSGRPRPDARTVRYAATIVSRPHVYLLDGDLSWSEIREPDSPHLRATSVVQARSAPVVERLVRILGVDPAVVERARTWGAEDWHGALEAQEISPLRACSLIFDYCHDRIAPASFSGTTDALTALRLEESSCGGKSRLMAAFCRTLGIPSRIVGGVILGNTRTKRTSHVWVECRLAGEWIPFDPLNDHYASVPENYLLLYRGDRPLIQHSRGLAFDYGFTSSFESVPVVWQSPADPGSDEVAARDGASPREHRAQVPLLRRQQFSIILLAPFALLFAVFARQVIGLESIGTFLPVLLGFCITQTGWLLGGAQLLLCILFGIVVRVLLVRLNLLHVPRIAIMITFVVLLFLLFSFVLEALDLAAERGTMILPLAALAMTVERFTVVA
ncbi:MAG: 7TM domain-containing protein, partial [Candidatus Krumholzibacteriia bacterium]